MQKDTHQRRGFSIHAADKVVILGTQLDTCNVLDAQRRTVRVGTHNDIFKFGRRGQAALGSNGVNQLLAGAGRHLADLAGSELCILFIERACQFIHGYLQLRHAIRLQPDAHRIVLGAEDLHISGAGNTLDAIEHIQRHIIGDEQIIQMFIGRIKSQYLQECRRALLHRHTLPTHFLRQFGLDLLHAVVDVLRGLVDVGADLECHLDGDGSIRR